MLGRKQPRKKPDRFRPVALALLDAEEIPVTGALRDDLIKLDASTVGEVLVECCVAIAYLGEITPRTVYDRLYALAPSDDEWEVILDNWKERLSP